MILEAFWVILGSLFFILSIVYNNVLFFSELNLDMCNTRNECNKYKLINTNLNFLKLKTKEIFNDKNNFA